MAKSLRRTNDSEKIEADLKRLEVDLRQLKVQYDMFFAGSLKRQPLELRNEVEKIIKRYTNASIRKYAHRFHLSTLVSRYNSLSELWGKTMRSREEGDWRAAGTEPTGPQEQLVAHDRFDHIRKDDPRLRALYDRFVEARSNLADGKGSIPFEKFVRGVSAQTRALQKKSGCGEIELRVVASDNKVELKARAGK